MDWRVSVTRLNTFVQLIESWFPCQAETSGVTPVRVGQSLPPDTKRREQLGVDLPLLIPSAPAPARHLFLEKLLAY